MRTLVIVTGLLQLVSLPASAERRAGISQIQIASRSARASQGWNKVVGNLKTLSRDKNLRAALRANHGSIMLGEALVPDRKHPGVATLKRLVMNKNGLVIHSRIGNHVEIGKGKATFIPLPKAHYKGSTAVRFSRFGIPYYTERLQPGEWGHLKPEAIRSAALDYKMTSAVEEAKRIVAAQPPR